MTFLFKHCNSVAMLRMALPHTKCPSRATSNILLSQWDESSIETIPISNQSKRRNSLHSILPTVSSLILVTLIIMLMTSQSNFIASMLLKYHEKHQLKLRPQNTAPISNIQLPIWTTLSLDIWARRNNSLIHREVALFWYIYYSDNLDFNKFFSKCLGMTLGRIIWRDNMNSGTIIVVSKAFRFSIMHQHLPHRTYCKLQ
jgi:hypothetical protein